MIDRERPQILLIEDSSSDARYIQELLQEATVFSGRHFDGEQQEAEPHAGVEPSSLRHETSLEDGLERLDADDPDIVLLDLNLPDSNGLNTLNTVRERDPRVPVIVLTGLRARETGIEAIQNGADDYLVKDELNADLLVRSVYHAIERRANERELRQYEALIEESTDATAIVDENGDFTYITPAAEQIFGYHREKLAGKDAFQYIHSADREAAWAELEAMLEDPDYRGEAEFRFRHADGSWMVLSAHARNLLDEPAIGGVVVYTHDITERKEYERRLHALNQLNSVVNGITEAAIERTTREEIERIACERLAESDAYEFAWIGATDSATGKLELRTDEGADEFFDEISVATDPNDEGPYGPTSRAVQTGETQTVQNIGTAEERDPWLETAERYGFRSSAAIPIRHEDTVFGVLNVYTDRADGFQGEERTVIDHLGEILGHAIASTQRKQALMSDTAVELEIGIPDAFSDFDAPSSAIGEIQFDQVVPIGDAEFIVYGSATEETDLEALVEAVPQWEDVTFLEDGTAVRFQLRLTEPPLLSSIASVGGSIERTVIEDGEYRITVRLPESADVRQLLDTVQELFPQATGIARRQVSTHESSTGQLSQQWTEALTDRQRTAIEVAYFSGFFEWPRESSGEEVAESLDVSSPTFHQHVRAAERKLLEEIIDEMSPSPSDSG